MTLPACVEVVLYDHGHTEEQGHLLRPALVGWQHGVHGSSLSHDVGVDLPDCIDQQIVRTHALQQAAGQLLSALPEVGKQGTLQDSW